MSDDTSTSLSTYIEPPIHVIDADETVNRAYRRMDANSLRTLLVCKDDKLLGLIEWQDIRDLSGSQDTIEEHTRTECPSIGASMSIDEALEVFDNSEVALGRFPVVDESGTLIGEIGRENFQARMRNVLVGDEQQHQLEVEHLREARGATIRDIDGDKLGTLNGVRTEGGVVTGILVKHGRLRKKYKPVPIESFRSQEDDEIILSIDKREFKILRDI